MSVKMRPMGASSKKDSPRTPDVINGVPLVQGMLLAAGMGMRKLDQEIASRRASAYLVACQEGLVQGLGMAMGQSLTAYEMALVNLVADMGLPITPEEASVILGRILERAREVGIDLGEGDISPDRAAVVLGAPVPVAMACEYVGIMQRVDQETSVERAGTIKPVSGLMTLRVPPHRAGASEQKEAPALSPSERGAEEL